jgi:quercetin dioxygenase-like cupin family protein
MTTKYVTLQDQTWQPGEVGGVPMETCALWEGKYNVRAGFLRVPKGLQTPPHHHAYWVSILVISGELHVEAVGAEAHTVAAGEYYFVEPGETHVETALEDTLLLVVKEEDREALRQKP